MDPAKRICLKNLPDKCTKREIAELIRNRTGTTIHSIDLGVGDEGRTRKYAHFSCEGAKHVLEILGNGTLLRSNLVKALPAKPHYSYIYAEARRKREREEAAVEEANELYWKQMRAKMEKRGALGELSCKRKVRNFYDARRRYALVASELAQRFRAKHKKCKEIKKRYNTAQNVCELNNMIDKHNNYSKNINSNNNYSDITNNNNTNTKFVRIDKESSTNNNNVINTNISLFQTTLNNEPHKSTEITYSRGNKRVMKGSFKACKRNARLRTTSKDSHNSNHNSTIDDKKSSVGTNFDVTVQAPQPSRDERKLFGLQAKLAALKEKLAKK